MSRRVDLLGALPDEIAPLIAPEPAFRSRQLFGWIQARGETDFNRMLNLPAALRARLIAEFDLRAPAVDLIDRSPDGTVKLRLRLADGAPVEAVLLDDGSDRKTACLSVQVGCAMGCRFCRTATMGLVRNLSPAEILAQLTYLEELPEAGESGIDSIVFMGMGEPFNNYAAFSKAVTLLSHPDGRGMSPRRLTVSTSGVIPGIRRLAADHPQLRLAVSLVSADPGTRAALMPVEAANPLPELREALLDYQRAGGRRITLEYVLLKGVNDRPADAGTAARFARGLRCNVNLIPWNPADALPPVELPDGRGIELAEPDENGVNAFRAELERRGLTVVLRYKKGRGVNAACGQLAAPPNQT